jgi:uncharacterized membrane protein YuzA (DUF378 family)
MRNVPTDLGRSIGRRVAYVIVGLALLVALVMLGFGPVSFAP